VFIGSDLCRMPGFGSNHPLAIPRVASVMQLCSALDWLEASEFRASPRATVEQLGRFHSREYIAALAAADASGVASVEARERFAIGTRENPLFPGVFARAATAVGGSILAAQLALEGQVAFHPAGGTHHGRPARASGFCYFNDPVFALQRLAEEGLTRILYVDLDAHHGDAVQDAVRDDDRMHTISIHEAGRWPFTGAAGDRGGGRSYNYPVPKGFNDAELLFLMEEAVLPQAVGLRPEAVVIICGTDGLAGDPLSGLMLSNGALWGAVEALVELTPVAVVLGGGGYNPWTVARCWTGLWARLSARDVPSTLPPAAQRILEGLSCDLIEEDTIDPAWLTTLADAPREGSVRQAILDLVAAWPRSEKSVRRADKSVSGDSR
jgi:acetoin utilization protein AcuC